MRAKLRAFSFLFFFIPAVALAAPWADKNVTDTDTTAAGSIVGPNATGDEVLPSGGYTKIDAVNETDCDVLLRFPNKSDATVIIPAGTTWEEEYGSLGGFLGSSVELAYFGTSTTCSSGSVYVRGVK